jgi:prophage regulatory protein
MNAPYTLPASGFLRLPMVLAPVGPIPVSKSTWWAGVKTGRFPKPVKLGPRITAWRVEDIRALIEEPGATSACSGSEVGAAFRSEPV